MRSIDYCDRSCHSVAVVAVFFRENRSDARSVESDYGADQFIYSEAIKVGRGA